MNASQRHVLTTTCLSHCLIHVYMLAVPALLWPIQSEFGADDLRMGQIATLYALLFGLGALPSGFLVDRLGSRPLLLVCLWGGALSMVGMAVGASLFWFALGACMMGLCLSIYHPAGTALITHTMPPSGRVFAIHGMAGNLGVAGASAIAGSLGALLGWRWAFAAMASVGFLVGLRVLSLPAEEPGEIRARPGSGQWPAFVLLLIATAFMGMVYRGMTTFLPKFLAVTYTEDVNVGVGGWLTTAALLTGLVGMFVAGKMVDRGIHPSLVFLAGGVLQIPLLLVIGRVSGSLFLPLFMGVAFFHFFTQPAGNHLVADVTPPRLRGLGYGVYFLMTFGAGSLGATLGGWVSTNFGLRQAFPALVAALIPSIVAIVLLWFVSRRRVAEQPPRDRAPEVGL